MDAAHLRATSPMGLRERMLAIPLDAAASPTTPTQNVLFINFERLTVRTPRGHRRRSARAVERSSRRSASKVYAIVNYDNFEIAPELIDAYATMVQDAGRRATTGASRATRRRASCA